LQQRLNVLEQDRLTLTELLAQAQLVEKPRVLTPAAAVPTTARSRRNSVVVGALIGLLLGVIAAVLWEPVAGAFARRRGL
jgi:hypothetical protein